MKPGKLWDMELSVDFRHGLTRYKGVDDEQWGWPLYGYKPDEYVGKACCAWADFIGTFVLCWNEKFHYDPHPEIVRQARTLWKRWSMTGYEAYVTMMQQARML
jgi:hypothetical protein